MNEHELKHHLLRWVEDYCNREFDEEDLPGGVALFLEQSAPYLKNQSGIIKETLGDHSILYSMEYPDSLMKLIRPYRRVKFP